MNTDEIISQEIKEYIENFLENIILRYESYSVLPLSSEKLKIFTDNNILLTVTSDRESNRYKATISDTQLHQLNKLFSSQSLQNTNSCTNHNVDDGGSSIVMFQHEKHFYAIENSNCIDSDFCEEYHLLHDFIYTLIEDIKNNK